VEFKSLTADEDHQYVLEHGAAALPEWIGEDVSDDKKYGGKFLAKNGPPPEALEAQKLI
jgi:CYTH domain-containing protein